MKPNSVDKTSPLYIYLLPIVKLLLLWIAVNVSAAVISGLAFAPFRPYDKVEEYALFLGQLLTGAGLLYFTSTILGIPLKALFTNYWQNKRNHFKTALKYLFIYIGFFILIVGAAGGILTLFDSFLKTGRPEIISNLGMSEDLARFRQAYASFPKLSVFFLGSCFFAPIIEELFYRRLLFTELRQIFTFPIALLVSSLVFGLFHGNFLLAFISGAYFACVYEKEKNLSINIILHAFLNFFTFILMTVLYHIHL